jgi:organic radical activating enzyme
MLAELGKCVIRCEGCHKAKTVLRKENVRGERVGISKLTEADVRQIRIALASGDSKARIARNFGVDEKTIREIAKGNIWKHVI